MVNNLLAIGFLGLAASSILYVVIELFAITRKTTFKIVSTWGVLLGLVLGCATHAIVTAASA